MSGQVQSSMFRALEFWLILSMKFHRYIITEKENAEIKLVNIYILRVQTDNLFQENCVESVISDCVYMRFYIFFQL
jgi:hypothetical protein